MYAYFQRLAFCLQLLLVSNNEMLAIWRIKLVSIVYDHEKASYFLGIKLYMYFSYNYPLRPFILLACAFIIYFFLVEGFLSFTRNFVDHTYWDLG